MSGPERTVDSVRSTVSSITSRLAGVVSTLALGLAVVGWSLFWSLVVESHLLQGDYVSAVLTTAILIVPALLVFTWYVGVDVMPADIDANVIGS